ncbi:MAG: quinone oxidoreductase [Planctomycetes bacterium]|nr:quinone oxidoreductase [Planctomycetota bacterium]
MARVERTRAIVVERAGGPEVLAWSEVELAPPAAGELRIRHTAVGLNFIDVYQRTGFYPPPRWPHVPGLEAAGVVEAVGAGVAGLAPGDRVAYATSPSGAYAQRRNLTAALCVRLPSGVPDELAAAALLKGLTAHYLVRRVFRVEAGHTLLVQAASGGVGTLLCQWAARLGARVIGTVSTEAKAERAREFGCHEPIVTTREDFAARVRELTGGRGCQVVYDSIGKDTFDRSLECLAPRGLLVSYGQSSGPVPPFDLLRLSKTSGFITRPTLFAYTSTRAELESGASELFDLLASGALRQPIESRVPLAEAARAHRDLESRRTVGATVLVP